MNRFFIGLHHPSTAWAFLNSMLSINAVRDRKRPMRVNNWILDSGAFTEISTHGKWRNEPERYAEEINFWKQHGNLVAAVSQDLMCEPFILEKTGLSVEAHQEKTIQRYIQIAAATDVYVMPVLQGFRPIEYATHVRQYGNLLKINAWVGVGSICKRNANPDAIEDVLLAIKAERGDLRLHGFGIKLTALERPTVRALLDSSDSMAWSYALRREDGNGHDPREALAYCAKVQELIEQPVFIQDQLFQWWN
jgi:hypothetical protein